MKQIVSKLEKKIINDITQPCIHQFYDNFNGEVYIQTWEKVTSRTYSQVGSEVLFQIKDKLF